MDFQKYFLKILNNKNFENLLLPKLPTIQYMILQKFYTTKFLSHVVIQGAQYYRMSVKIFIKQVDIFLYLKTRHLYAKLILLIYLMVI